MLIIEVPEQELYDETTGQFVNVKKSTLQLEHSLISLSKWESNWKKPFLEQKNFTRAELVDYVRCMTMNEKNVDQNAYAALTAADLKKIENYIVDPHTATTIYDSRRGPAGGHQIVTSELIYYQMVYHHVPGEYEKWHLNRLMTLLRICNIKGTNDQMSMKDIFAQNRALHAARSGKRH